MDGEETKLSVVATSRVNKGDYTRDYKLSRTLGQGSFAKVRIGKCRKDQSTWAIKIIDRKALTREDADALGIEVDAMLRVHHKNIVKLREVYDAPHQFVMVLELCTGGELFDRIVAHKGGIASLPGADKLPPAAAALIDGLLNPDQEARLAFAQGNGAGDGGIASSEWFAGVSWGGLTKATVASPCAEQASKMLAERSAKDPLTEPAFADDAAGDAGGDGGLLGISAFAGF